VGNPCLSSRTYSGSRVHIPAAGSSYGGRGSGGLDADASIALRRLPVEGIDFLGANVAQDEGRIIRSEACPSESAG